MFICHLQVIKMNIDTVKIIFKKELKESIDLKYMKKMLFILFLVPILILFMNTTGNSQNDSFYSLIPIFSGFFFYCFASQLLQRKFFEVKALNGFQPLLVLPITLREIWAGKFLSILTVSYLFILIMDILILISLIIKLGTGFLIIYSLENIIIIFFVYPAIISILILISSWVALRFKDYRVIDYFNTFLIISLMIGFLSISTLNIDFVKVNMNFLVIVGLLIVVLIYILFYYLIGRIKKEML